MSGSDAGTIRHPVLGWHPGVIGGMMEKKEKAIKMLKWLPKQKYPLTFN